MEKLLSIGKIVNFHGIKGEVKVGYSASKKERLNDIKELYVVTDLKTITVTVESIRFHKNCALIKFKEFSSINDVIDLKGAYLKVPKSQIQSSLEEDEYYIDDLIGMEVYDNNKNHIGKVSYTVNIKEEDLLVIKAPDKQEYIVPFVRDLVPEVNIDKNRITVNKIPGLLEELSE